MCAKNHLLIFSSLLDIWENVEWPRFFGPPCIVVCPPADSMAWVRKMSCPTYTLLSGIRNPLRLITTHNPTYRRWLVTTVQQTGA